MHGFSRLAKYTVLWNTWFWMVNHGIKQQYEYMYKYLCYLVIIHVKKELLQQQQQQKTP